VGNEAREVRAIPSENISEAIVTRHLSSYNLLSRFFGDFGQKEEIVCLGVKSCLREIVCPKSLEVISLVRGKPFLIVALLTWIYLYIKAYTIGGEDAL
jgi:hypothetical protein